MNAETNTAFRDRVESEKRVHACMKHFVERWTRGMDVLDASEFYADLVLLIKAVHRDANR